MKLDTRQTFCQIHIGDGKKFTDQLLKISKHTNSQDEAAAWAQNLRFVAVPKDLGFHVATHKKTAVTVIKKEEKTELSDSGPTCDKSNIGLDCACELWPKFPRQELSYLALTEIGEVQNCNHHVAISYCCSVANSGQHDSSAVTATLPAINVKARQLRPSKRQRLNSRSIGNSTKPPYDIMTRRGMRKGRVPRGVMDRALRYAANKDLSFIWIDQECIEQDDPLEKELAIQSMHLVYRRSEFPLGLLTAKLVQQQHLDALNFAIRYSNGESLLRDTDAKSEGFPGIPGRERPVHGFIRNLAEVLKIMARDKWLTRGWVMQEMVLAGEKMVFSVPCDPSLRKPEWGGGVDGELHFTLDQLVPIFDDVLSSDTKAREFDELIATMDKRLNVGRAFYASYKKLRHITLGTNDDGDKNVLGYYRVCNPLAAILYLEDRANSRNGDRLAIVANLCDYAVRLNSTELEKLGFGYSTCLLAMMLLNGDITYMIEWAKAISQPKNDKDMAGHSIPSHDAKWDPPATYSWMPGPHASLSLGLNYDQFIDNGNFALATIMDPIMQVLDPRLSEDGLYIHGWTWNITEKLDLQDLQRTLKKSWPSILQKAEELDDFASLAAPATKLVLDLFSTLVKSKVPDLTLLLWHHLVLNYLGDWSEVDGDITTTTRLSKAWVQSLSQLGNILSEINARYDDFQKTSLSPNLILRLLLARLKESSTVPPELEWIFNLIMGQGYLRWGRLSSRSGSHSREDQDGGIAVFECPDKNLVLTPQMRDPTKDATERRQWMRHFRQQPGSWIIECQNKATAADNNVPIFETKGMVRGLWRIGDAKPSSYILS